MFAVHGLCTAGRLIAVLGLSGAALAMEPSLAAQPRLPHAGQAGTLLEADLILFDMPRMPLHDALQRYSSLTGRSVLYDSGQVTDRWSSPLKGRYTADAALRALINASGMQARFASDRAFMLTPISSGRPALGQATHVDPAAHPQFYGQLQARVKRALCADATLESGAYRLALRFRVDAAQTIEQLQVHATGRADLEPRIQARLQGLPLGVTPPSGVPQPILLLIAPRKSHVREECAP
ncbi:hypothetical protein GG851_23625 [Bordetella petrii]|nr:hypothetical protein [Bordetella petrii]